MTTRELHETPRILPLYARALAPLLPGASRLPWVGGGGGEIPDVALTLAQVRAGRARVDRYAEVCAFEPSDELPATFVHVLAFPLHLALMADPSFPFAAVGLVHVANRIVQRRPLRAGERFELRVRATPLQAHRRGRTFTLVSEASVGYELVWEEHSTMLHREAGAGRPGPASSPAGQREGDAEDGGSRTLASSPEGEREAEAGAGEDAPEARELWQLPADLGRRYAAVSGDRNPIHLHPLSARALGFPRAIAHGMWTKARCLAALTRGGSIPSSGAFAIDASFRRPILLPASVAFASVTEAEGVRFGVRDAAAGTDHLDGCIAPPEHPAGREETAP